MELSIARPNAHANSIIPRHSRTLVVSRVAQINAPLYVISVDCTGCLAGYSPRGYLTCEKDPEKIFTPAEYVALKETSFEAKNQTLNFNEKDYLPIYTKCSSYVDISSKSFLGVWAMLKTNESTKYISLVTNTIYDQTQLEFLTKQQTWVGEDTALILQDSNGRCLHSNDDVVDFVSTSSLTFMMEKDKEYYVLIHGYYGEGLKDTKLFVREEDHPCKSHSKTIEWNDLIKSGGINYTTKFANSVLSSDACVTEDNKGNWFLIHGAQHTILVSGSPMKLQVVSVTADVTSCEDDSAVCELIVSTDKNGNAALLSLEQSKDYYFFFSYHPSFKTINFNIKVVCSGCTDHCSLITGGCICQSGKCDTCGNGKIDIGEECDNSFKNSVGCNPSTCTCDVGFTHTADNDCVPNSCGDGVMTDQKECDGGVGCTSCLCDAGYVPYENPRAYCLSLNCGNGKIDGNEECDSGEGCYECECQEGYYVRGKDTSCKFMSKVGYIWLLVCCLVLSDVLVFFFILGISYVSERKLNSIISDEREAVDRLLPFFETNIIPFNSDGAERLEPIKSNELFEISNASIVLEDNDNYIEVNKTIQTSFTITNKAFKTLHFTCHSIDNFKYSVRFQPVTQSLKPSQTIRINLIVTAKCTTKVDDEIFITLRYGKLRTLLMDLNNQDSTDSKNSSVADISGKSQSSSRPRRPTQTSIRMSRSSETKKKRNKSKLTKYYTALKLKFESSLSTRLDLDEITLVRPQIGEGTYGTVYRAEWRKVDVAVKVMKTDTVLNYNDFLPHFIHEAQLMETIRSQFIINFIGSAITEDKLCLVTEFCVYGSLRNFMKNMENEMTLNFKFRAMYDIAHGMYYLHQNDIVHRDLKPDNVLVFSLNIDDAVCFKVSDFGTAGVITMSTNKEGVKDLGTPMYMAPEVHSSNQITFKSDVFSFAVCCLEIYLRKVPYPKEQFPDTESILKFVCAEKRLEISDECPVKKLITMCWSQNPQNRPDFRDITMELKLITGMELSNTSSDSLSVNSKKTKRQTNDGLQDLMKAGEKSPKNKRYSNIPSLSNSKVISDRDKLKRSVIPSRSPTSGVFTQIRASREKSFSPKNDNSEHYRGSLRNSVDNSPKSKNSDSSKGVEKMFGNKSPNKLDKPEKSSPKMFLRKSLSPIMGLKNHETESKRKMSQEIQPLEPNVKEEGQQKILIHSVTSDSLKK
ncbi:serine-threonine protein kinase, putative [Entamoeba invadens IP1]|uniref:Serine-threonine protein kinase, putative n=1 Tax=Entamoeba invadens IP1 TaxID=370355 RepID=A0A0A1U662_ENTIV|nr:serine-threonine protein kinase, putative [Entamoeba invadens IP1]ELP89868.1 serine-threonine protein kinase, putative [Entamoeba invadens IP1]|eukprot:XP_004256639.1 serine-threonine protein kinase, putative [Entamoeba invadens IP1]